MGSGAVAQGPGAVAAGAGGIAIGRDFKVYTDRPPRDPEEALGIYCRVLVETGRDLSLRGAWTSVPAIRPVSRRASTYCRSTSTC